MVEVESALGRLQEAGVRGVILGKAQLGAASIALDAGAAERFRYHAMQCANEFKVGHNPALTTLYENLMRRAHELSVSVSDSVEQAANFSERTSASAMLSYLATQMSTCVDMASRCQTGISALCEGFGASGGFLYLMREHGLSLAAAVGQMDKPEFLDEKAEAFWKSQTELDAESMVTDTMNTGESSSSVSLQWPIEHGHFTPFLLADPPRIAPAVWSRSTWPRTRASQSRVACWQP